MTPTTKQADHRIESLAEKIYLIEYSSVRGSTKTPKYNFSRAVAAAVEFYERLDSEKWDQTAAERFAEIN